MSERAEDYWHNLHAPLDRAGASMELIKALLPELLAAHTDAAPLVRRMRYRPRVADDQYAARADELAQVVDEMEATSLAIVGITRDDVRHLRNTPLLAWLANVASLIEAVGHVEASITGAQVMLTTGSGAHEPIDLHTTIEPVIAMWDHTLLIHGGTITRALNATNTRVRANRAALASVWSNFIDNALRASTSAEQRVTISLSTRNTANEIIAEFTDDGPGIPADLLPKIFESGVSTRAGGGRGLDYVRRTITAHRGSVSVTSEPGNTAFEVRLPLA